MSERHGGQGAVRAVGAFLCLVSAHRGQHGAKAFSTCQYQKVYKVYMEATGMGSPFPEPFPLKFACFLRGKSVFFGEK